MAFLFEKLDVYGKAVEFARATHKLVACFPKGSRSLSDQMERAAISIVANIAEGNGRFTKADRKHFFDMARASAFESAALLDVAYSFGFVKDAEVGSLKADIEIVSKMISGLIQGIAKRKG